MIPPGIRIFVCTAPVDMRFGFDRLIRLAQERVGQDPIKGGALFVFRGRSAQRLKALWMEPHGVCLLYKRLHGAAFEFPIGEAGQASVRMDATALACLLAGVPLTSRKKTSL